MTTPLEADYLVVGAGAMGLAFVDTILNETDADVVIVDRYDKPGGHWRVAYDFVRLHQPSDCYGVNSRPLGSGAIETAGYNAGLLELATVDEIRHYFERVLNEKLLASGRVRYLPNSEFLGDGKVARILSGDALHIRARRCTVDGTFMQVTAPAVTSPPFVMRDDVQVIPPNGLARTSRGYDRYVVAGGGKTGIDTVLWLLERGTPAEQISWTVPRDPWLLNREAFQPGPRFVETSDVYRQAFVDAWLHASTMDDLYDQLVEAEYLFRLSDQVRPTAYRCATVTRAELAALRTIDDVVRLGHVLEVNRHGVILAGGVRDFHGDVLYINCTANGLARRNAVPVFQPGLVTLQPVTLCQQVYSAAFIAHVEARFNDDVTKNSLTTPVPHPEDQRDFIRDCATNFRNELLWWQDPEIVQWRQHARLAGLATRVGTPLPPSGPQRDAAVAQGIERFRALMDKADGMLRDIDAQSSAVGAG